VCDSTEFVFKTQCNILKALIVYCSFMKIYRILPNPLTLSMRPVLLRMRSLVDVIETVVIPYYRKSNSRKSSSQTKSHISVWTFYSLACIYNTSTGFVIQACIIFLSVARLRHVLRKLKTNWKSGNVSFLLSLKEKRQLDFFAIEGIKHVECAMRKKLIMPII